MTNKKRRFKIKWRALKSYLDCLCILIVVFIFTRKNISSTVQVISAALLAVVYFVGMLIVDRVMMKRLTKKAEQSSNTKSE